MYSRRLASIYQILTIELEPNQKLTPVLCNCQSDFQSTCVQSTADAPFVSPKNAKPEVTRVSPLLLQFSASLPILAIQTELCWLLPRSAPAELADIPDEEPAHISTS